MVDILFETGINLFQSFMYIGFLYLFFEKSGTRRKNIISFVAFAVVFFLLLTYFSFFVGYLQFFHSLDFIAYISVMELYTIFFLKGDLKIKLLMPVFAYLINTVISYTLSYTVSYFTKKSHYELATISADYRYLCVFLINTVNVFIFLLLIKIRDKELKLMKWTDLTAFIFIPLLTVAILYSTLEILYLADFDNEILAYLIVICVCTVTVAVIVWIMMTKISRKNKMETKLLLANQKSNLYESNIIQIHTQIEKMSKMKHDMSNHLRCIRKLLEEGGIDEAKKICGDVNEQLISIYTPINTPNILLNAVVNVELEKASNFNISFLISINDTLMSFAGNTDLISLIGNLCDNAIEYLKTVPQEYRAMALEISKHNSYCIITCKNKIITSVLAQNPELSSHKSNDKFHGKGIGILKAIAQKYHGDVKIYEKEGFFHSVVILEAISSEFAMPEHF